MQVIQESEYKKRRDTLSKKLSKYSVAILFSSEFKIRSNDTEYPYRQNSNFYYLSGFKEDKSALVFIKSKQSVKTLLFVEKKDETLELWNGKRVGKIEAKKRFLVDEVLLIDDLKSSLKEYLKDKNHLYFDFNLKDSRVQKILKLAKNFKTYKNISLLIGEMRLVKSTSEIKLIKKAISITKKAHHKVMSLNKQLKHEFELQAEIEYKFKKNGSYSDAYTSIVACGNSANTLHYISNNKALVDNELILIDAGCEYEYYASDITRTIPVNGKFTQAQKELYSMILDVQLKIIKMIKPGIKRSVLQKKSVKLLCKGMVELGILKGSVKKLIKEEKYKKYYPHGIGHWMGLDVHDEVPYKDRYDNEILFKEGMVLTIEPGIYCQKDDKTIPEKYRGIGIRIEDDILVKKNGYKNLSAKIAKSIEDIEKLAI